MQSFRTRSAGIALAGALVAVGLVGAPAANAVLRLLTNVWFAVAVAVGLLVAGSAYFASTVDTPGQWTGALVNAVAVGASGVYVGTMIRLRRRRNTRR